MLPNRLLTAHCSAHIGKRWTLKLTKCLQGKAGERTIHPPSFHLGSCVCHPGQIGSTMSIPLLYKLYNSSKQV